MKKLVSLCGIVGIALLFHSASAQQAGDAEKDKKQLIGTWQIVGFEGTGKSKEQLASVTVIFTETELTINDGGNRDERAKYKLDGTKKPAHLDIMPASVGDKQQIILGIYELAGDSLKIAYTKEDNPRPTTFDKKAAQTVMELKRQKK